MEVLIKVSVWWFVSDLRRIAKSDKVLFPKEFLFSLYLLNGTTMEYIEKIKLVDLRIL